MRRPEQVLHLGFIGPAAPLSSGDYEAKTIVLFFPMKKAFLFATLMSSMSFSAMSTNILNKGSESSFKKTVQNASASSTNKLKNMTTNTFDECGFVTVSVSCDETFYARTYSCGFVDEFEARQRLAETYCD
jgi:hypothetical protein